MDCNSSLANDIIPGTPEIQKTKKPQIPRKQWICSGDYFIPNCESAIFLKLKNPICPTVNKVYVFHSFREVLNYTSGKYPKNDYLKIIGQYKNSDCNIPYIQGYEINDKKFLIFLNTRMLEIQPKLNEIIEVYGHLEFQTIMKKDVPIIIAHFFRIIEKDDISDYINCLIKQKKFVPESCLVLNETRKEVDDSLVDFLQNLSLTIVSIKKD